MTTIHLNALTLAASLALGVSLVAAAPAEAVTFYDFDVTWNDNTQSQGWFKIEEAQPSYTYSYSDPGSYYGNYSYDSKGWNFLDFSFTHQGTTYGLADLSNGYGYKHRYDFPTTSSYQSSYGDWLEVFDFYVNRNGQYIAYVYDRDSDSNQNEDQWGYSYLTNTYATNVTFQQRSTADVPEPAVLAGLAFVGVSLMGLQRKVSQSLT